MASFPESSKQTVAYSTLTWDAAEGKYKYIETITYWCTEEAVDVFNTYHQNVIAAEAARDTLIVKSAAQAEIDWVKAGKATGGPEPQAVEIV